MFAFSVSQNSEPSFRVLKNTKNYWNKNKKSSRNLSRDKEKKHKDWKIFNILKDFSQIDYKCIINESVIFLWSFEIQLKNRKIQWDFIKKCTRKLNANFIDNRMNFRIHSIARLKFEIFIHCLRNQLIVCETFEIWYYYSSLSLFAGNSKYFKWFVYYSD